MSSEKEQLMIEKIAQKVVQNKIETAVLFYLQATQPTIPIQSALGIMFVAPFLECFGIRGYDYLTLLMKAENVDKLMKRIEELVKERDNKPKSS